MQVPMEIMYLILLIMVPSMLTDLIYADDPLSHALLTFKSDSNAAALKDWVLPPQSSDRIHACSWTGVRCNDNSTKLTGLDLSMKNLRGSLSGTRFGLLVDLVDLNLSHNSFSGGLPAEIFKLRRLTSLDISRNNFSGAFPAGISQLRSLVVLDAFSNSFSGTLPPDASALDSLEILNFAGSYFTGPIPSEYGSFKSLRFLHLAGNFLNGAIPPQLGSIQTLSHMEIGYNSYEGGIPSQFGNLTQLDYLDIADANISGPIPKQLANLTKLESLFLFRNQLTGKIPWEMGKIPNLKSLDLSDNQLSGPIPDTFAELKNLKLLSLMYNDLNGSIPAGIAELPQLDTLLIWSNYFTGSLPEELGRHSRLKHVDVSTNFFVGNIPAGICDGGELMKLILFSNGFDGGLSPSLSNCSSLVRLRLEDNSFAGEISLNFDNLPDISYVDLSRNMFRGGIPSDIVRASRLEYFNVSNNPELGGSIPMHLWSSPNLHNFSMASCGVSGSIPPFEYCKFVYVIELGGNNLSGYVQQSVSNCKHLVVMDLSNNNLSGTIPSELASLPTISILDLSHNGFTGPIPDKFGSCSSLKLLNVSYNDVSGSIPSNRTFKMMDQSAFVGNPKLCGAPLRLCGGENGISNGLELGSRRAQKVAWVLILCAVTVVFMVAAAFGIVYLIRGSRGQWRMVAFNGLPQFTAKDVLRSFDGAEDSMGKVVLPTGITVSVKKIEWERREMKETLQFLTRIGNSRHENLVRLLGICYNNRVAYLLYEYMGNGNVADKIGMMSGDWETKSRIIEGVAKALCFLHHECYPAIAHGSLKASNVLLDENMEPHLAEYGLVSSSSCVRELEMDVYNFGQVILEVLTANGRVEDENEIAALKKKSALDVALLCTSTSHRPTMQYAFNLLIAKP